MHRALFISEVLQDIFAHLDQFSSSGSLTTLAAVARTCKIFHEPAMDLLWADMIGIIPLLGCVARLQPMIYTDDKVSVD
jgi:hypothetical protein